MALPPEQPGGIAPPSLIQTRAQIAAAIAGGLWRTEPPAEEITLDGIKALRFAPPGAARGTMLHFHGGAYRLGAPETIAPYAAALARDAGLTVICPAYRLAPEHPFPAALKDGLKVIQAVKHITSGPLLIAGDSAGGGLAAGLTALAIANGIVPAGLILLSAWLDLTVTSSSFDDNAATDPLFSRSAATEAARLYLGDVHARHPAASPLFGSTLGFPATFISAGDGEVLVEDARAMTAKLQKDGIAATLSVIPGMQHVAVTRGISLPGSAETFAAILRFIDDLLK